MLGASPPLTRPPSSLLDTPHCPPQGAGPLQTEFENPWSKVQDPLSLMLIELRLARPRRLFKHPKARAQCDPPYKLAL